MRYYLGVERSNKAIYIYLNRRILARATKEARGLYNLTDNKAIQLEEDLLTIIEAKKEVVEQLATLDEYRIDQKYKKKYASKPTSQCAKQQYDFYILKNRYLSDIYRLIE